MKKLSVALVLTIAALTGLAGATASSTGSVVLAEPCCKYPH
jgi:hypothetical protein